MVAVDNATSGKHISVEGAEVLLALAGQVGTAIQGIRHADEERAERARLSVLVETARAFNSTLDSNSILRELAARLVTALGAANVVFVYTSTSDRTCVQVAQHTAPGRLPIPPDDPESVFDKYPTVEKAVMSGDPFHGSMSDPGLAGSEREFLQRHDLLSELLMPVSLRGETIGMLQVYWDHIGGMSPDAIALCTAIAEQVAMALGNARLYADASHRAEMDALTGLYNHSAFLERVDRAVADAASFSLVLLDVDNFKLFNDTFGHITGNSVLTSITFTIREMCRDGDVGGRYGGDELAVLLAGATRADAQAVVRRLIDAVKARPHETLDGAHIPISVSAGIACFPEDGHTRQELIAMADAAMYAAKRRSSSRAGTSDLAHFWPALPLRDAADLLGDSPFGVLEGLVSAVDAKDRYTREHSDHVTHLALLLADALGLDAEQRRVLTIAGLLHDVGKIGVPDRILRKPGALSDDEFDAIKRHVSYGVAIIRGVLDDKNVVDAVAYHHERWDGYGYPHGISGHSTPLLARIMQVADAASAMLLDRPYRKGLEWPIVASQLRAGAGAQFDPELVEPFVIAFDAVQRRFTR
ncbi:MAG: diguanylate cyclase domain/uncharacterized domain [Chloroflexi bacterium]|nr:diguanylate cyclase domain/uncharacterized domain [Chloroflexota bacterium]